MKLKPVTSIMMAAPMGTPRRSWASMAAVGAAQTRLCRPNWRIKRVTAHHPQAISACVHMTMAVADTATHYAHGLHMPRSHVAGQGQGPAVDEQGAQRDFEYQAGDLNRHHRFGSGNGRVEAAVHRKQHGGWQGEGQCALR
jgi:hypothetical protein